MPFDKEVSRTDVHLFQDELECIMRSAYREGFMAGCGFSEFQEESFESWWQNSCTRRSLK